MSMSSESHHKLAADMQALSLDQRVTSPSESVAKSPPTKTAPVRVHCLPLPPSEEYKYPLATGQYYFGIYLRERAVEDYAIKVNPALAKEFPSLQYFYGIDYLRALVRDSSIDIQIAIIRPRHRVAMPFIAEEEEEAPFLRLFPLDEEAYKTRMTAKNVEKLVAALGARPDWFELSG